MKSIILIAGLTFGMAAFAAETGQELYQRAVTQETAAGNLEEAIKLYQRVAKEFASDRALAAKALERAAECYEKFGKDQQDKAVQLYQQVASQYKDQAQPAATASARLAAIRQAERAAQPVVMTQRKIEIAVPGVVKTDGQRAIYRDDATGAIMISDLAGKNKRVIFKGTSDVFTNPDPSRDFSMVLLSTLTFSPISTDTLAVIKTDSSGYHEIGRLDDWRGMGVPGWSWDNRYVLISYSHADYSYSLVRIDVASGQSRELRRSGNPIHGVSFSPDGRFIAYTEDSAGSLNAYVLPSQGGEPWLVASGSAAVDWTRDGRFLAIGSPLSRGLYLLPVKDGQAAGEPILIRSGDIISGRTTATGSLLIESQVPRSSSAISLGTLDRDGRVVGWKPLNLGGTGDPLPSWSPDSSQIAYVTLPVAGQRSTVHLRNIDSGADRELYSARSLSACVWAAQHPELYCGEQPDIKTSEIISIAVDSGRVERLASIPGQVFPQQPSRDDSALYLAYSVPDASRVLRKWEIGTHQETLLGEGNDLSPDERWLIRSANPREPQSDGTVRCTLQIRPLSSDNWRDVSYFRIAAGSVDGWYKHIAFTPDGKWLYFYSPDSAGKDALFRASAAGGEPERVGDFPSHSMRGSMKISPDGRKIIVNAPDATTNSHETWLLENFEPRQPAAR